MYQICTKMKQKKAKYVWDKFNTVKNWMKHQVRPYEVEEVFTSNSAITLSDLLHSILEERYILLGRTRKNRVLYIVFVIRNKRIRPISFRDANKKEVKIYEEKIKNPNI